MKAIERFFGELARELVKRKFAPIVVAGGETSGAAVTALNIKACDVEPEIAPGVPCLLTTGQQPIAITLKSGNFGGINFFE